LWEFPVNEYLVGDKSFSSLSDLVVNYPTSSELYNALIENYNRHVEASKTPFHLAMNSEFLTAIPESGTVNALQRFFQTVNQSKFVTIT
jgi:hypothetical protein